MSILRPAPGMSPLPCSFLSRDRQSAEMRTYPATQRGAVPSLADCPRLIQRKERSQMEFIASAPVTVRSYIGVRRIGKTLCLLNQKRRDAWICSGSSLALWGKLSQGMSPQDVAGLLTSRMGVPAETARADVNNFVEQLWQRQIIDVAGLEHFSNDQRAAMLTERPHNRNGVMVRTCVENE